METSYFTQTHARAGFHNRTGVEHSRGPARVCHSPQFVVCTILVTEREGVKTRRPSRQSSCHVVARLAVQPLATARGHWHGAGFNFLDSSSPLS